MIHKIHTIGQKCGHQIFSKPSGGGCQNCLPQFHCEKNPKWWKKVWHHNLFSTGWGKMFFMQSNATINCNFRHSCFLGQFHVTSADLLTHLDLVLQRMWHDVVCEFLCGVCVVVNNAKILSAWLARETKQGQKMMLCFDPFCKETCDPQFLATFVACWKNNTELQKKSTPKMWQHALCCS